MNLPQRFATVLVVCLCIWAPVHFLLQERYELSAWKFHGMAMYNEPSPRGPYYFDTDSGPDHRPAYDMLPELCSTVGDWHRRGVFGGLSPTRAVLACWKRNYPQTTSARLEREFYGYNVFTGEFRTVNHVWLATWQGDSMSYRRSLLQRCQRRFTLPTD